MAKSINSPIRPPLLHEVVAERILKEQIAPLKSGQRLASEAELAAQYQVSVPTVREALRSLSQSGFVERRQGSGTYRSEKSPTAKKQPAVSRVAIVCPLDLTYGGISCHFVQVALHAGKCLQKKGLEFQLYYGETAPCDSFCFDDSLLCRDITQGKIAGAIIISDSSDAPYKQLLHKFGTPTIVAEENTHSLSGMSSEHDFLVKAVDSLMGHNRRKLAYMGSVNGDTFRDIVLQKGGVTDDSWIVGGLHPNYFGSGYSLMREIWSTGKIKPDGLVISDDVLFSDVVHAVQELGLKIPDQLMITCHVNTGVRLIANFPVIELQFDSLNLARQLADRIECAINGLPSGENIMDHQLVDPFIDSEEESESDESIQYPLMDQEQHKL